jgi:hypothetical protein
MRTVICWFAALLFLSSCSSQTLRDDGNVQITEDGIYSWKAEYGGGYDAINPLDTGWPDAEADTVLACWASEREEAIANARAGQVFGADPTRTDGTGAYFCRLEPPGDIPS